ncbi:hypothetical protein SHJG_4489 [Streptomyces hygroscopicus subsp. jinggangensis 5008]|nr:hypothetical protein SHJG_4489 [Streptomyces hygroscopicus subsp. jinggangensis 5008]AGF63917.1 hypothetical protein SHJGH_4252 [Streptomyces hygroscopicus subsp. jinggangensis TL01]
MPKKRTQACPRTRSAVRRRPSLPRSVRVGPPDRHQQRRLAPSQATRSARSAPVRLSNRWVGCAAFSPAVGGGGAGDGAGCAERSRRAVTASPAHGAFTEDRYPPRRGRAAGEGAGHGGQRPGTGDRGAGGGAAGCGAGRGRLRLRARRVRHGHAAEPEHGADVPAG